VTVILLYCSLTSDVRHNNLVFYRILCVISTTYLCGTCYLLYSYSCYIYTVTMILYSWTLVSPCTPKPLKLLCYALVLLFVMIIYFIRQLTLSWGKLMGPDLISCLWWPYSVARSHSWGIIWKPPVILWGVLAPHPSCSFFPAVYAQALGIFL